MMRRDAPDPAGLSADGFKRFLAAQDTEDYCLALSEATGVPLPEMRATLDIYFAEMRFGFDFVAARLRTGDRHVLEIGAGLGFLALYLARHGYEVWAVEPAAQGFGLFHEAIGMARQMAARDGLPVRFLTCGAQDLTGDMMPGIDFAYSVNVIEHIAALEAAVSAVLERLSPDGIWCNTCPNYVVPYEPHFGILLVPFCPRLTRFLAPRWIAEDLPLWESLNFVTAPRLRRIARRLGAGVRFERGVLYQAFLRLETDEAFGARHREGPAPVMLRGLRALRVLPLLAFVPPGLATPMQFTLSRADTARPKR